MLLAVHSNLKYHSVLRGQFEAFQWPKILFTPVLFVSHFSRKLFLV